MMDGFGGHGWGMGLGMGWWWFIGIALVVFIVWLVARNTNKANSTTTPHISSMDILKNRYAKGEIEKEEFEERKKELLK